MLFKAEVDVCVIRCLGGAPSLELSAFCVANAIFGLLMNSTFYKVGGSITNMCSLGRTELESLCQEMHFVLVHVYQYSRDQTSINQLLWYNHIPTSRLVIL